MWQPTLVSPLWEKHAKILQQFKDRVKRIEAWTNAHPNDWSWLYSPKKNKRDQSLRSGGFDGISTPGFGHNSTFGLPTQ